MVAATYPAAYRRLRTYEGGNDDDPQDPGGRTSRGIIQRVYDGYRANKGLPKRDVWLADEAEVAEIYRRQYWDAVRGDQLPAGVDMFVFDGAVNSGPKQSIKWLQRGLGGIVADGVIGEATMAALRANHDNDLLIGNMADQRMAFLRALKTFPRFGRGWTRRVNNVCAAAQALATGSIGPAPVVVLADGGHQKATVDDVARPPVSVEQGAGVATGGGIASGTLDQLSRVSDQLAPFQYTFKVIQVLCLVIALVGVGFTIYALFKRRQTAAVI
ncbi:glycoside hydrolase family 108 protein [Afipia carboxidovorans]|uniref:glycoside hydrolase family 108 protein n=1 Tax=Afipia carboxidovorans TaxID=40137 RepID=UPI0030906C5F|nr:glycosyl hydrolase 108 family protein [Afipia carboxidovorans]